MARFTQPARYCWVAPPLFAAEAAHPREDFFAGVGPPKRSPELHAKQLPAAPGFFHHPLAQDLVDTGEVCLTLLI